MMDKRFVGLLLAGLMWTGSAQAQGQEAWDKIYEVLSHPRCANCHVEDDNPRWSGNGYGPNALHAMHVRRGVDGFGNVGMRCTTCHGETNSAKPHAPPGAHNWHLAPVEMAWFGKDSATVCAQIKDPNRTGGRDLVAIAEHIKNDPLVGWGWNPGPGREPAPGTQEQAYRTFLAWIEAGAPCPE